MDLETENGNKIETSDDDNFLDDIYDFANAEKEPVKERRPECQTCG